MRAAAFLLVALAVYPVYYPYADGDLISALLDARNPEERAGLLRGHDPRELAATLDGIEKSAGASYDAKNFPAALNAYDAALLLAHELGAAAKLPFYFRRAGICHAQLGQTEAALDAYRAGIAAAEQTDDSEMLMENLHGAALNLQRLGRYREALTFCRRESALAEKSGQPEALIHALTNTEEVLQKLGRLREALPLTERAFDLSRRSSQPADYATTLGNLGILYSEIGEYETSLRILRGQPDPTPNTLNSIAICEVRLHREADAEVSYRAAITASTAPGQWRIHGATMLNLGILQHQREKLAEARASVEQGLAVFREHQDWGGVAAALAELAVIAGDEKKGAEAMEYADEALRMARQSEDPTRITDALVGQAHALEVLGRDEEAGQRYTDAVAVAEGLRADTPASATGLQNELAQWLPTYQYAIAHEIRTGDAPAALRLADRAKARVLLDMLDGGEPGFDALADPGERAEEQQVRNDVSRARRAAVTQSTAASKAALESALRKKEEFDIRLYGRHPELLLQRAAPPDIRSQDLAALASNPRTALLSYFVLQDSVALFVVRGGNRPGFPSVRVFTLARGDKLEAMIRSFRSQIAARDLDYRVTAKALYEALLGPAAGALGGTDRWILSPDGALWDVPFQALMDSQGKHLLETHTLSFAPSLAVLRELRNKPAAAGPPRLALLAVANPSVRGVAPIPEAQREASAIAALYGAGRTTLLAGERANPSLFREFAGGAGVIHIASHAETETNHPLESFLLLAPAGQTGADDGALTARDLLGMRLRASLVVLSACETARGRIGQGDGVMGLGWAVLAAGARASVLSQWQVDSGATSDLMIDFHRRLTGRQPQEKADALRQAALDTMRSPGRLHPFYWAAFIVVGDAR